ncbi:MAG: hypothetical protein Q7J79_06815, partial [Gemmatimonadales bacterium]|nr:hypothetical protein [Gemmatimonadales bacterium]
MPLPPASEPSSPLLSAARRRLAEDGDRVVRALYSKDPSLWVAPDAVNWLGWLDAPQVYAPHAGDLLAFADEVRQAGFARVALLGMGGSSLAPEVFFRTFGPRDGFPPLVTLDTTDPSAILNMEETGELARTFFLVSSKSGTTVETNALLAYFWERTGAHGPQFAAITDPGTPLAKLARERGFRRVFENAPDIGGRFSALSCFGLVPAALMGVDIAEVLARAAAMAEKCAGRALWPEMVGPVLGAFFAEASVAGRDKLTIDGGPTFDSLGVWAEQLVAESTGKGGKGLVPIVGEPAGARAGAGADRAFVTIDAGDPLDLGAEFFQWEVATAVAGAWMGLNPFDQPNVAESKTNTEQVLKDLAGGAAPEPAAGLGGLESTLREWASLIRERDYVALLAWVQPTAEHDAQLARMRRAIGAARGVATTAGYGPRFLHSTGQLHKGGADNGVFLQIETENAHDLAVPGAGFTFGRLKLAQALGD